MLNVKQLLDTIGSMKKTILQNNTTFQNTLIRNYAYFHQHDLTKDLKSKNDSSQNKISGVVLLNFKPSERQGIIRSAKNSAVFMKETIVNNKENRYTKSKLLHKHEIVFHKKFTFSIACFLLFFIGAPFGAIIRKGGLGLPAVISTIFFILFWVLSFIGEKYTVEGVLPAYQGMWIAPSVLLPIGVFLTYKASVDASLFDIDSWSRFFIKIFRIPSSSKS
jgi:lipopolysaccharide export system permease protein